MFGFIHHVPDGKCFKIKELFTGLILPEVVINNITVDAINPSSISNNQNTVVKTCGNLNRVVVRFCICWQVIERVKTTSHTCLHLVADVLVMAVKSVMSILKRWFRHGLCYTKMQ